MTSSSVLDAVRVDESRRCQGVDSVGHQCDVGLTKHREPAIVQQHSLTKGRVVRKRCLDQICSITQLIAEIAFVELAMTMVGRIDRGARIWPVGVDLEGRVHLVVEDPRQTRPVPLAIAGDVVHQPVDAVVDGREVVVVRCDPLW